MKGEVNMPVRRVGKRRRVASLLVALVLPLVAACEKINSVSSSVSPCFRVLPLARLAIGKQGTFVDVARLRGSALPRLGRIGPLGRGTNPTVVPRVTSPPGAGPTAGTSTTIVPQRDVCLVAYKGTFDVSKIPLLMGQARTGKYAVVIVGVRTQKVRAVVLTDKLVAPLHAH
jgi:hypothetical protein